MLMWDKQFRRLLGQVAAGKIAVKAAVDKLAREWLRMPLTYFLDETTEDLDVPLAMRNYNVAWGSLKWRNEAIKELSHQGIYITRKPKGISGPKSMERHNYGVLWVTAPERGEALARKIEQALTAKEFFERRARIVKFGADGEPRQWTPRRIMPKYRAVFTRILNRVAAGKVTVKQGLDKLMNDYFGSTGRILTFDRTVDWLPAENLPFTLHDALPLTALHAGVRQCKKLLGGKVLITRNGAPFANRRDMRKYHYGLVWITAAKDDEALVKKIAQATRKVNFRKNLTQVVKVRGEGHNPPPTPLPPFRNPVVRPVRTPADRKHMKTNRNRVLMKKFSSPESAHWYRYGWLKEPKCHEQWYHGQQCGGCSFYAEFDSDWGLCCHGKSRHFTETVFEHFTCPSFVNEGWGPHSFNENPEHHCRCQGDST